MSDSGASKRSARVSGRSVFSSIKSANVSPSKAVSGPYSLQPLSQHSSQREADKEAKSPVASSGLNLEDDLASNKSDNLVSSAVPRNHGVDDLASLPRDSVALQDGLASTIKIPAQLASIDDANSSPNVTRWYPDQEAEADYHPVRVTSSRHAHNSNSQ